MFMVDSSEKTRFVLFDQQKDFVLRFSTKVLQLHLDGLLLRQRLSALQYSSKVLVEHSFKDWQNLNSFQTQVASMDFIGHGTFSAYAITNATKLFRQETSPSSLRVALLMTDGSDHPHSPSAVAAAAEAKQHHIRVFTIGLSAGPQRATLGTKLRSIASAPPQQHVLSLADSQLDDRLLNQLHTAIKGGCPQPKNCICEKGEQGLPGSPGKPGEPGSAVPGPKGSHGETGMNGLPGAEGLRGQPGSKGIKGECGESGASGAKGENGVDGPPGPTGLTGNQGTRGAPGDSGPEGPPGPKGELGPGGE
ncbi:collagen alpha-1(XXVIII) chain, partial [Nematolebias whitei]|uniref:collagen alpha-1(XXVIII) chain n=1 Tax=Nematolebias whitei TaxID=451745 RepID=UPI001896F055